MGRLSDVRANQGYERWRKWAEWPMIALAGLFIVVLLLPLTTSLTPTESAALDAANIVIWAVFALEFAIRLYLAYERARWVRTHAFDLIVVAVPFLRPLRLLRVVAVMMSSSRRAGALVVRRVLVYVTCSAAAVTAVCAVIVYHAERYAKGSNIHSLGSAIWWALTTVTTVGYGDTFPVTVTGRITAAVLMFVGIALVGCITAAVAAAFVNAVRGKPAHDLVVAELHGRHDLVMSKLEELTAALSLVHDEVEQLKGRLSDGNRAFDFDDA